MRNEPPTQTMPPARRPASPREGRAHRATTLKVPVVDDDADAAWAIATHLRLKLAGEVRTANDGAQAIDEAVDMRPDAIVMDLAMPGIGGLEAQSVLRRLFEGEQVPRLIALTGCADPVVRHRALSAGFQAYLLKPVDLDELLLQLTGGASA